MVKLKYENFMRLSEKEKCIRYKDLNDFDKQKVRMTEPMICSKYIGFIILTEEQRLNGEKMIEKIKNLISGND